MIRDIVTVWRKEWLEILDQFRHIRKGGWSVIVALLVLGVFLPLQVGPGWAMNPLLFFYWPFLTASMTSSIVADSIAGERERHTLETLLATRLDDTSILLGKLLAAITYGYAFALTNLGVGFAAVLVVHRQHAVLLTLSRLAVLLAMIGTAAAWVAGLGVFVSLRAATVRQAQQVFGMVLLALMMVPALGLQLLPEERVAELGAALTALGPERIAWRVSGVFLALAVLLVLGAVRRFRRGRLALE